MNPYKVLGVEKTATLEDIKQAYRKMAMKYHPDRETGNKEIFQEIQQAYELLCDEAKRNALDALSEPETAGLQLRQQAISELCGCVRMILEQVSDVDHNDIVHIMQRNIEGKLQEVRSNMAKVKNHMRKNTQAIKRMIKKTEGENFLVTAIKEKTEQLNNVLEELKGLENLFNEMLVLLKDFDYNADKKPDSMTNPWFNVGVILK